MRVGCKLMKRYIHAENLKNKRTFLIKLPLIAPIIAVLHAFVLMPFYFTVNAYNWWYVILMPATFALIPALMHRKEDKKLNYRAIFPLDVNLKKVWVAKIVITFTYMGLITLCHLLYVLIFQWYVGRELSPDYSIVTLFFASLLLLLTNIWQIPWCFFLAKKFGLVVSVVGNAILGLGLGILVSDSSMWLYCPYSWGLRLMVPVLHILPNGVPTDLSNPMITSTSLWLPCLLSICLFYILTISTANWFSKQEVTS